MCREREGRGRGGTMVLTEKGSSLKGFLVTICQGQGESIHCDLSHRGTTTEVGSTLGLMLASMGVVRSDHRSYETRNYLYLMHEG
jgi:hypothetical protein